MTTRNRWIFLAGGLVLAAAVAGGYFLFFHRKPPGPVSLPSPEERLQLIAEKNVAVGHLENGEPADFLKAEPIFRRIAERVPGDPLGHRNLIVALFAPSPTDVGASTRIGKAKPQILAQIIAQVDQLLAVDGADSVNQFIAGRMWQQKADDSRFENLTEFEKNLDQARGHFRRAAELAANDPAPLYALYRIEEQYGKSEQISDIGLDALRGTHRRDPGNLAALLELLQRLAERKHPDTAATIQLATPLVPALAGATPGQEPHQLLQEAHKLLEQSKGTVTDEIVSRIVRAHNVMKGQSEYQQARRRVHPHLAAFVLTDFRPNFYEGLPPEQVEPAIAVRFEPFQPMEALPTELLDYARDDLDLDDVADNVVLLPGTMNRLEVRPGKPGVVFEPYEAPAGFTGFQLADFDLDFKAPKDPPDLDLVLYGADGVRLLENRAEGGKRRWVDRTKDAKLPPLPKPQWVVIVDMDHDSNLDVLVGLEKGVRILRNLGSWEFEDVTPRSQGLEGLETVGAAFYDLDGDVDLDGLLVTRDRRRVVLENRRGGQFHAGSASALEGGEIRFHLMFDADNDRVPDLLMGQANGALLLVGYKEGIGTPGRVSRRIEIITDVPVRAGGAFDFDNDSWADIWLLTEDANEPLRVFRNVGGERFKAVELPAVKGPIRGVLAIDADNDGDLDLLYFGPNGLNGLRNQGGNQNHWLAIRLQSAQASGAQAGEKCNYSNIGGTIEIKAGRHSQIQQVAGRTTHFGLGQRKQVDLARTLWTNGVPQAEIRPQLDAIVTDVQVIKGSCPHLFTWDGTRFRFVTDCLWTSALGMKLPDGSLMGHDRQFNYLVIRDDQLKPRDGRYVLQFTNELWEVPYLDEAELWVVDHPADVEVYANQRIPPDPKELFRLLPVRKRHVPVAARDHHGRDVLDLVRDRDNRFLGGFRRQRYVGLAEPHWLELDLGNLNGAKEVTLYLTGWVWPTDTSANVAISTDPRLRGGPGVIGGFGPPALLVADGKGGWQVANPNMGFMSGKLQTVAVDLTGKFPSQDYRVRIATSMELYWDDVFFTVDQPGIELPIRKLPVSGADLHRRGYSRRYQEAPIGPFLFDYDDVDRSERWVPMKGPYTRYGDVTPLLRQPDSQSVVMSPGDELTLEFAALPPPPPGRKRTYLFFASGWLKDFDLNGTAGDQAGPLPFDGMKRYPYAAPDRFPESPELQRFLREYMTREK